MGLILNGRVRGVLPAILGSSIFLGSLSFLGGCGGGTDKSTAVIEVDPAVLKAKQDAERAEREKAMQKSGGNRGSR